MQSIPKSLTRVFQLIRASKSSTNKLDPIIASISYSGQATHFPSFSTLALQAIGQLKQE